MIPKIYLDTNVFITAYETSAPQAEQAWWLLDRVERGTFYAVTSELTLAELLVKPLADDNSREVDAYQQLIAPGGAIDVCPVSRRVLILAAHVRVEAKGLRLPDAIHVATARDRGCSQIVSGDLRLPAASGLAWLRFGDRGFSEWQKQWS